MAMASNYGTVGVVTWDWILCRRDHSTLRGGARIGRPGHRRHTHLHARLGSGKLPRFLGLEGQDSLGPAFLFSTRYPLDLVFTGAVWAFPFLICGRRKGGGIFSEICLFGDGLRVLGAEGVLVGVMGRRAVSRRVESRGYHGSLRAVEVVDERIEDSGE